MHPTEVLLQYLRDEERRAVETLAASSTGEDELGSTHLRRVVEDIALVRMVDSHVEQGFDSWTAMRHVAKSVGMPLGTVRYRVRGRG